MKQLLVISFFFSILSSSCFGPDIRFVTPQPEHLDEFKSIPAKFQGLFVIEKDTIEVTEYTINNDSINSEYLVVKGWGNYLFVNIFENGFYKMSCGKLTSFWNHERLSIKYFSSSALDFDESFSVKELIANEKYSIIDIDTINGYFILDNVSVNQFQHLLNNANSQDVIRISKQ